MSTPLSTRSSVEHKPSKPGLHALAKYGRSLPNSVWSALNSFAVPVGTTSGLMGRSRPVHDSAWSLGRLVAAGHVREETHDLLFQRLDIGFDDFQRTRRLVAVEVPVERDLVADFGLGFVDPGVWHVRTHLALEVLRDALL